MITFKQYLIEGGNVRVGDATAQPINVAKHGRENLKKDLHQSLSSLHDSFHKEHGEHLFGEDRKALKTGSAYSGSTAHLFNKKIDDPSFVKHKATMGDVDVQVPKDHLSKLHGHLAPGKKFGKYTVVGTKKHGVEVSAIMKHEDGSHHQVDFEGVDYKNHEPSEFERFAHSSDWHDTAAGVKGVHHKLLVNAVGTDKHKFSITHGLRSRTDETDPGEKTVKGISTRLFGKAADHSGMGSFHGVTKLIRNHVSPDQHQAIYDKFKEDANKKKGIDASAALAHLRKHLNVRDSLNESTDQYPKVGDIVHHRDFTGLKHLHSQVTSVHFGHSPDGRSSRQWKLKNGHILDELDFEQGDAKIVPDKSRIKTSQSKRAAALGQFSESTEETHHTTVVPLTGFTPFSHMGHAKDLGETVKKLPGTKHVGISGKSEAYSAEERKGILERQWGSGTKAHVVSGAGETIRAAHDSLPKTGRKILHLVVGHDRKSLAEGLKKSLEAGKIKEMEHHKFDEVHIHYPEDTDRSHGMSGTNMRNAAHKGDLKTFHNHLGRMFSQKEATDHMKRIQHGIKTGTIPLKR